MIHPAPTVRDINSSSDPVVIYSFKECEGLTTIDCATCVKNVLIRNPHVLKLLNRFLHILKQPMQWTYPIDVVLKFLYWVVDASVGQRLAAISVVLTIMPITSSFLVLRYDMVKLLFQTYEFWYITVINIVCCVAVGMEFADWRCCGAIMVTLGNQNTLMIDANFRSVSTTIIAATISAIMLMFFIVYYALGFVDAVQSVDLLRYNGWSLRSCDVAINGLSTIVLILLRNAYRRFSHIATMDMTDSRVRCISYRARVRLVPVTSHGISPTETAGVVKEVTSSDPAPVGSSTTRLQLVKVNTTFTNTDVVGSARGFSVSCVQFPTVATRTVQFLAIIGAIFSLVACMLSTNHARHRVCTQISFWSTSVYCSASFLHQNRKMLRLLVASFDYLFLSAQLLLAYLTIGYLLRWNERCYLVLTLWLWGHWIVTLDAIMPDAKSKLGVTRSLAMFTIATKLSGLVMICAHFTFRTDSDFEDRVMWAGVFHGRPVKVFSIPFLFSRVLTIFFWCLRLLWRLGNRHGRDGLIMIQGGIEYKDMEVWRRSRRLVAIRTSATSWRRSRRNATVQS
ncbi:hypothetical protein Poli38472_007681 [Pythium oligandrum]|uniref:Uncharacterized protein n=1 Tax=Pythium oligandrum TaxID=41045 RepID=A0A8K1FP47_PYTOL|nr:hypothetical protein Poli38472_007681 [Pythium oligandrum]|eukprot:TMW68009.1 hypothetical protein Poli38472_007681 [Pythium oligandrum]